MNVEILAIGDPEKIKEIASEFVYVERDNTVIISVPKNLQNYTISCLSTENIKAMTITQFQKAFVNPKTFQQISQIARNSVFDWLYTGNDFFYMVFSSCFELCSIDKKTVKIVNSVEPITNAILSNNGSIYAFVRTQSVTFYISDMLELLLDIKLKSSFNSLLFSKDDKLCAISTSAAVQVYEIFTGKLVGSFPTQQFYFVENSIYLPESKSLISPYDLSSLRNLNIGEKSKNITTLHYKNQYASFIDGPAQKIIFNNGEIISKTMNHVKSFKFYFSGIRLFALLVKNPGGDDCYILESYSSDFISSIVFDNQILDIAVSDDFFVVQLSTFELQFYSREKKLFKKINSVIKDGPVKLSCQGGIFCIFDKSSGNVEFYDRDILRSVFSHPGCTDIEWSKNGIYVATFSYSDSAGCLVQIFNCNGLLMFKKVYNSLKAFKWRNYPDVSDEVQKQILEAHSINEIEETDEDEGKDIAHLLLEWKEYLLTKIKC
ncbi:hypothetical protein GINT2_002013 [Glugoides intestinalis]